MKVKIIKDSLYPYYSIDNDRDSEYGLNLEIPNFDLEDYQRVLSEFFEYQNLLDDIYWKATR